MGELIYAFVITRVDIGSSVTTLCQYNAKAGEEHYKAAQQVMTYLAKTPTRGLIYWRPQECPSLVHRSQETIPIDFISPDDPYPAKEDSPYTLTAAVDCPYATAE